MKTIIVNIYKKLNDNILSWNEYIDNYKINIKNKIYEKINNIHSHQRFFFISNENSYFNKYIPINDIHLYFNKIVVYNSLKSPIEFSAAVDDILIRNNSAKRRMLQK